MAVGVATYECEANNPAVPKIARWGVARTRARAEKVFGRHLQDHDVPYYLPLIKKTRLNGRHRRCSHIPLFPGYVFFDLEGVARGAIWDSRRVAQILEPPDSRQLQCELENLALALGSDESLQQERFARSGMPVEVVQGKLKGVVGELVRRSGRSHLVIRIAFIQRAVELVIDDSMVEPIR